MSTPRFRTSRGQSYGMDIVKLDAFGLGAHDVLLGHLQPGSVQVRAGASVAVGEWLGSVGNSGNTSEPHLRAHVHAHAQRPGPVGAPLGGDPLPLLFGGRFPVRGDRIVSP